MRSRQQRKALSSGRPPTAPRTNASLSKRATQKLIRSHHQLQKKLHDAEADGNHVEAQNIENEINKLGGLKSYQQASIQGQSTERGGDSSKVLMEWMEEMEPALDSFKSKPRMLEVGALSTRNACSKSNLFDVQRIDLNSQAAGIVQQDFMERPLPESDQDHFDIISLSLVLNFVPTAQGRGAMLRRTCQFLRPRDAVMPRPGSLKDNFPALFLVLPAACIINSRYMTEDRLTEIMGSLGYTVTKRKQSAKLVCYLWTWNEREVAEEQQFPKTLLNPGPKRNNFGIVL